MVVAHLWAPCPRRTSIFVLAGADVSSIEKRFLPPRVFASKSESTGGVVLGGGSAVTPTTEGSDFPWLAVAGAATGALVVGGAAVALVFLLPPVKGTFTVRNEVLP